MRRLRSKGCAAHRICRISLVRCNNAVKEARLMVLDTGHFHAALLQKDMYAGLSRRVAVYAPLGPDVLDYLNGILRFHAREERPTSWDLDSHASGDFLERML